MYSSSFDDERPLPEEVRSQSSQSRVFCSVQDVACQHGQSVYTYTVTTQVFLQRHTTRSHKNLYSHMLRNNEQIPPAACQRIFSPARDICRDTDDEPRPCRQQFTKTLTQPEAKTHQLTYKETTSHNRKLCECQFSQFSHMKTHLNTHSGENVKSKCKECDKRFYVLRNLKRDQQIHTGEQHFHCKQCDKSSKVPGDLNRRQRLHAGEVLPHQPEQRDRLFNEVGDLRTHLRIHTGEQPFPRKHHENRFTQLPQLTLQHPGEQPFHCERHPESHQQRPTGALKPFRCQQCGKSFSVSGSLTRHQRIHTGEKPYYCGWCKKGFNVLSSLKRHQRVHTGEKPYRCEQCDRSFNEIGNLKTHQRTHTGEKPFQCRHCDKRFCQASHLKRHQTTHTGGEAVRRV